MTKSCCYPGCSSDTKTSNRSLFSFPVRDPTRRSQWITILGCSQTDAESRTRGVCDLHFDSKYIVSNQRRRALIGMAVPNRPTVDNSFEFHCLDEGNNDETFEEAEEEMYVEYHEDEEVDFIDDADVKGESGETITEAVDYYSGGSMDDELHSDEITNQVVDSRLSDNERAMDASATRTTQPRTEQLMRSSATNISECDPSSAHSYVPHDKEPLASIPVHKDVKLQRVFPRPQLPLPETPAPAANSIEEHPDVIKTTSQQSTRSPTAKRQRNQSEPELQINLNGL